MLTKRTLLAVGAAVLLPVAALAMDHGGPPDHAGFAGEFGGEHDFLASLRSAQLTDAQRTQIHELMRNSFAANREQMQQLRALHKQIEDTIASDGSIDEHALLALQKQVSTLRDELDAARITTVLQARALLTPSQRAELASVHQKLEALHEQEHALMGRTAPEDAPGAP